MWFRNELSSLAEVSLCIYGVKTSWCAGNSKKRADPQYNVGLLHSRPFCVVQSNGGLVQSSPLTSMTQYRGIFVQVTVHVEPVACQSSRVAPDRWPHCSTLIPAFPCSYFTPGSQFVVFRYHGCHSLAWSVPRLRVRKCNHSNLVSKIKLVSTTRYILLS